VRCGGRWAAPRPLGRFVADVTIPDGSIMEAGQVFVKTWRMRNEGTAPWETNANLAFVGGDSLSSVDTVVVPGPVAPGQDVDLSVEMTAPTKPGRYVGYWRLQLADGTRFGQRVWVDIFVNTPVPAPATATAATTTTASSSQQEKRPEEEEVVVPAPAAEEEQQPLIPAVVAPLYPVMPAPSAPAVDAVPVPAPSAPAMEEDSVELKQLLDMGFSDRALNIRLLEKNKYNMLRTVQDLLAM